jgi:hypothetical protein
MPPFLTRLPGLTGLLAATLALAGPAHAKIQYAGCHPVFRTEMSHADLVMRFGRYVELRKVHVPEDGLVEGTVIFPQQEARNIEIIWKNKKARNQPLSVTFRRAWRTQEGVGVGTTLAEVEKINGRPFRLSGFDWDFGGTVTDWHGGKLDQKRGACRLVIRFGISDDLSVRTHLAVSGDKDFSSRDRRMVAAQPVVREIALIFE